MKKVIVLSIIAIILLIVLISINNSNIIVGFSKDLKPIITVVKTIDRLEIELEKANRQVAAGVMGELDRDSIQLELNLRYRLLNNLVRREVL